MEHQTLGRRVIRPSESAYYIVDCRIFYLTDLQGLTTEEFLSPRNWASALQKTMEGERQHLSPHIGDFNDDSKTKISQNGLSEILYKEQAIQIIRKALQDFSFVLHDSTFSTHLYSQSLTTLVQ